MYGYYFAGSQSYSPDQCDPMVITVDLPGFTVDGEHTGSKVLLEGQHHTLGLIEIEGIVFVEKQGDDPTPALAEWVDKYYAPVETFFD